MFAFWNSNFIFLTFEHYFHVVLNSNRTQRDAIVPPQLINLAKTGIKLLPPITGILDAEAIYHKVFRFSVTGIKLCISCWNFSSAIQKFFCNNL